MARVKFNYKGDVYSVHMSTVLKSFRNDLTRYSLTQHVGPFDSRDRLIEAIDDHTAKNKRLEKRWQNALKKLDIEKQKGLQSEGLDLANKILYAGKCHASYITATTELAYYKEILTKYDSVKQLHKVLYDQKIAKINTIKHVYQIEKPIDELADKLNDFITNLCKGFVYQAKQIETTKEYIDGFFIGFESNDDAMLFRLKFDLK